MKRYIDALDNRRREIENEVDAKNPFDAGVMRAIEASKKSLALNTDQEHRAIRKGLHMFSDALNKQYGDPRFRERDGTLGKVASLGPAISAGLEGYEAEGEKIQHDMKEVLEVAKKLRDSEIKRLREQDKDAFDAYFKDKQLGLEYEKLLEQERYHQGLLENKNLSVSTKESPHNKDIRNSNLKKLEKDNKEILENIALVETLNDIEDVFNKAKEEGYIGSSLGKRFNRKWASYIGDTEELDLIKAAEAAYLGRVKQGGGSNPSTFEFKAIMQTAPTSDKDYNAAIKILKRDRNNALKNIQRYNDYTKKLKQTNYLADPTIDVSGMLSRNSFDGKLNNSNNTNNSSNLNNGYIKLYDPETGNYYNVPIEEEELAIRAKPSLKRARVQ
jgi:hypothetical protein